MLNVSKGTSISWHREVCAATDVDAGRQLLLLCRNWHSIQDSVGGDGGDSYDDHTVQQNS